jgi:CRISPR-associated protein Csb2
VDLVRAQVVKDCIDAGFPAPAAVEVSRVSHLDGVSDARSFKQYRNGPARWATHATIIFQHRVNGPVLIGAGRYNGLGMLTPDPRESASHWEEPG